VVGQWYHLAVTKTGTLFTIYVNGNAVGSEISTPPIGAASAPLTIGEAEGLGYMQGRLDELTIYSRNLAPGEIQAIYNAGSGASARISKSARNCVKILRAIPNLRRAWLGQGRLRTTG